MGKKCPNCDWDGNQPDWKLCGRCGADLGIAPQQPAVKMEAKAKEEVVEIPRKQDVAGCFYHEGRDAVNRCSRCGQHICSECNYVTGTHPICRNCWDKRFGSQTRTP